MKRLIWVDRDPSLVRGVIRHLSGPFVGPNGEAVELVGTYRVGEVLKHLRDEPIDALCADEMLATLDGRQLLSLVSRRRPWLPRLLFCERPDQQAAGWVDGSILQRLAHPTAMAEQLRGAADRLLASASTTFRGVLQQATLPEVVQAIKDRGGASAVAVRAPGLVGRIEIRDGRVTNSLTLRSRGEAALGEMMSLRGGHFAVQDLEPLAGRGQGGQGWLSEHLWALTCSLKEAHGLDCDCDRRCDPKITPPVQC